MKGTGGKWKDCQKEKWKGEMFYLGLVIVRSRGEMRWAMSAGGGWRVALAILIGKHGLGVRGIRIGPFGAFVTVVAFQPSATGR